MSIPRHSEAHSFGAPDGRTTGTPEPIKYIWPKRIAVILAGLALVGGVAFGVKTLLRKDGIASTSQETVQTASPAPEPSQAAPSPAPGAYQAPQFPSGSTAPMALSQAVTESAAALSSEQTAEVKSAVKSLQAARDIRLWVVYVDAFDVPAGE